MLTQSSSSTSPPPLVCAANEIAALVMQVRPKGADGKTSYHIAAETASASLMTILSKRQVDAVPCEIILDAADGIITVKQAFSRAQSQLWQCKLSQIQACIPGGNQVTAKCFAAIECATDDKGVQIARFHVFSASEEQFCQRMVTRFSEAFEAYRYLRESAAGGASTVTANKGGVPHSLSADSMLQRQPSNLDDDACAATSPIRRKSPSTRRKMATDRKSLTNFSGFDAGSDLLRVKRGIRRTRPISTSSIPDFSLENEPLVELWVGAIRAVVAKAESYSNLHIRILGLKKEQLAATGHVKFDKEGFAVWNDRFSIRLRRDIVRLPRPYVVLELWGKEGGTNDSCLGACRLLVSQDAPSHSDQGSWVSLHRASALRASIQVHLGWMPQEKPIEKAVLPTPTQMFPKVSTETLYNSLKIDASRLTLLLKTIATGFNATSFDAPVEIDACEADKQIEVSVPPRNEPILSMLPSVILSGVLGCLALTSFRVIFVPIFPFMMEQIFSLMTASRPPSHLMIRTALQQHFGEDAVSRHRDDIREVLAGILAASAGEEDQGDVNSAGKPQRCFLCLNHCPGHCNGICMYKRYAPLSLPISTIFKTRLELVDEAPKEDVLILNSDEMKRPLYALTLHCKTCRNLRFEVQRAGLHAFATAYSFPIIAQTGMDDLESEGAFSIRVLTERFVEELKWLSAEGNFSTLLVHQTQYLDEDEVQHGCRSHSTAQLGMFDFSFMADDASAIDEAIDADADEALDNEGSTMVGFGKSKKELKQELRKTWQPDSRAMHCVYCNEGFTFLRRRHHCRHCGVVVCDHCSQYRLLLPGVGKVRTCVRCYHGSQTESGDDEQEEFADKVQAMDKAREVWEEERTRIRQIADGGETGLVWWDPLFEFARLGVDKSDSWAVSACNGDFRICSTYSKRIVLPVGLELSQIRGAAKFRSKGRMPILSWIHPRHRVPICRCSQPLTGVTGRSSEDDMAIINAIISTMPKSSKKRKLVIFDARPKVNAMANQLKGKGYERVNHYGSDDEVNLVFLDIGNIHVVRSSMQAVVKACADPTADLFKSVADSRWMNHLSSILKGAVNVVETASQGVSSVIHCSDGWDRTSQLVSLAQVLIDETSRTTLGFCKLIQKEWIAAGHMFARRCGAFERQFEQGDSSPVFVQWLDAVYQVLHQFPHEFEFNERLLLDLVDAAYSEWFGTFLQNSEEARERHVVDHTTFSFWEYVRYNKGQYQNILYVQKNRQVTSVIPPLIPRVDAAALHFWGGLYRRSSYQLSNTAEPWYSGLQEFILSQQQYISQLQKLLQSERSSKNGQTPSDAREPRLRVNSVSSPKHAAEVLQGWDLMIASTNSDEDLEVEGSSPKTVSVEEGVTTALDSDPEIGQKLESNDQ